MASTSHILDAASNAVEKLSIKQEADLAPKKEFPLHVFPEKMQKLILENERINGFSRDFMAASMIVAVGGVAGNTFKMQLKKTWHEPGIIWIAIVGSAGSAKSPALNVGFRPVYTIERMLQEENQKAREEHEEECAELEKGKAKPKEPRSRSLLVNNVTMEKMLVMHKDNPNGLIKKEEELVGIFKDMNAYRGGKGSDMEIWLNIYDNGFVKVDRMTRRTLFVSNACIPIIGGIQPKILEEMAKDGKADNGFMSRFLFVYPDHKRKEGWIREDVPYKLLEDYEDAVLRIHRYTQASIDGVNIPFTREAEDVWANWKLRNDQMINATDSEQNKQVFSKLEKQCIRLALVLHLSYWSCGEIDNVNALDDTTMANACELAEYFRHMAQKSNITIQKGGDERIEIIEEMLKDGIAKAKIASKLNMHRSMLYRILDNNPWLKEIKKKK